MKRLIATLVLTLVPALLFSQSSFDSKRKMQDSPYKLRGFKTIKPSKSARKSQVAPLVGSFREEPLYITKRNSKDESYIFLENVRIPQPNKNLRLTQDGKLFFFLDQVKEELKLEDVTKELKTVNTNLDVVGGTHFKLQQTKFGIPVYGGEIFVHTRDVRFSHLNGHLFDTKSLVKPSKTISEQEAYQASLKDLSVKTVVQQEGLTGKLMAMKTYEANLLYYPHQGELKLAYEMTVRPNILERWVYIVDAVTAEILENYNHTCSLDGVFQTSASDLNGVNRIFVITESGGNYFMVDPSKKMFDASASQLPNDPKGAVWTIDASNARINDRNMEFSHVVSQDGRTWNPVSVSAHTNASIAYDYFENTFGRNSLNGSGGNVISVINITDEDGSGMDNAYWNGVFMGYGNGNRAFKPLAGALDVAGHEMTHGVIENTAKLEYRNQSGALNESFADIFGALIDRDDWTLGEDVVKTNVFPSGALRSLQNPNQGGKNQNGYQPKNMSQYEFLRDIPSEDNGGVHINSGIPNHAFYLFATANGMSREKAEQIYYHTLSNYMTRTSQFLDLRLAVIQSAKDLYGDGVEAQAARSAFDAVGILETTSGGSNTDPTPSQEEQEIPVNPGDQFVLVYEPVAKTLYSGPVGGSGNFRVVAEGLGCRKKPSVTDDGAFAFFVGEDRNIYAINLRDGGVAQAISSNSVWENVAISKDGRLLAALTDAQEPYIYVFDLENNENVRFQLYNPTYTSGLSTGEVLYADSFEWDYSGEYLVYDAFNRAQGVFGNFEYWDVGILRAWDVSKNDFAEGDIQKIFSDLEEGDNIGNPAIAKTNPNVLAFDYLNSEENRIFVIGVNLLTNDIGLIAENNTIGFPDYTVDDQAVAYNTQFDGNREAIRVIAMNQDRISSPENASSQRLFSSGEDKWAVFYAAGERSLPQKQVQELTFSAIEDQDPGARITLQSSTNSGLLAQYSLVSGDASLNGETLTCGQLAGKVGVRAFQVGNSQFTSVSVEQEFCIRPNAPLITQSGERIVANGTGEFQWYLNGNAIGGRTTDNFFEYGNFSGSFTVTAFTSDGCMSRPSNTVSIVNQIPLSNPTEEEIEIYPNPVVDAVSIKVPSSLQFKRAELMDITGKIVQQSALPVIQMSHLPAGNYQLKVTTNSKEEIKRFIKL